MSVNNLDKLAFLDIETSGPSPSRDRVIEIGLVLVDGWKLVEEWEQLVNPGRRINPIISSITGIKDQELMYAPRFDQVAEKILEKTKDRVLIAHNVRFDYGFLQYEFRRHNFKWQRPHACSVRLSRKLYPEYKRHGLDKLIERFSIECSDRHRALADARVIWDFIMRSKNEVGEERLVKEFEELIKTPSVPMAVEKKRIDELPETPGVYIFYDEFGQVLYVGKSINIKKRVRQHFYSDLIDKKELKIKERVAKIETVNASGDLEAQLMEADMVKLLQPTFNRKLKHSQVIYVYKLEKNEWGYLEVRIEPRNQIDLDDLSKVYGVFGSKSHAINKLIKLAKEYGLCDRWLGLEKTKNACFGYHLGRCDGACMHAESPDNYNSRLEAALDKLLIDKWKFDGAIGVKQENKAAELSGWLIFDNWMYLGRYADLGEYTDEKDEFRFDFDKYKILRRFLNQNGAEVVKL